jgi:hypothetical protein
MVAILLFYIPQITTFQSLMFFLKPSQAKLTNGISVASTLQFRPSAECEY